MDFPSIEAELKRLTKMLVTLEGMGVVKLDPPPPASWVETKLSATPADAAAEAVDSSVDESDARKNPRHRPWHR